MFIPGVAITAVTFPGVVVHEFAHQLFCRIFGVAIFEVKYFQIGNPAGYVVHEPVRNPVHQLFIGTGPFFVNTILAALIAFPAALPIGMGEGNFVDYLLLYLGVSIGMHAFPSTGDAKTMWNGLMLGENTPPWLKAVTLPVVGLIYLGALGSVIWLDLFYGMAVALGIPAILMGLMV
ncbi:MAG TPA: metalloprotease family protein [Chitinophaga sp.]